MFEVRRKPLWATTLLMGATVVISLAALGCNSDSGISKEQEEAIRHPTAVPGYKGPDPASRARMEQSITDFQKKHANDKVQFSSTG
jgi:hypothetical protein